MNAPDFRDDAVFVIGLLKSQHKQLSDITPSEIERAIAVAKATSPSLDAELLRGDVELVLETCGAALFEPRNRGRRDEIIRGALR